MSRLRLADPDYAYRSRTPLGECLIQLIATPDVPVSTAPEPLSDDQFQEWQTRWAGQQDQIARRLAMIEEELDRLADSPASFPTLRVFGNEHEELSHTDELAAF